MVINMANPFVIGPSVTETASAGLPIFKEFAWDFEKDQFIFNSDGAGPASLFQ